MFNVVQACAPWLNWRSAGSAALVIGGIVLCTGVPSFGVLAGITPLLLIIACLVPCLAPLVLLRKKARQAQHASRIPLADESG
jgi:hypothetical protein